MLSHQEPKGLNGHSSNAQIGLAHNKVVLNEALWSTDEEDGAIELTEEILWTENNDIMPPSEKYTDKEVQSSSNNADVENVGTDDGSPKNLEDVEEVTNGCESVTATTTGLEQIEDDLGSAEDSVQLLASEEVETGNEKVDSDPITTDDVSSAETVNELTAVTAVNSIGGRPALRGGSPFNSSFTVRSEPCSPNTTSFPRLRKADAMASLLTSPGKRSHDESSASTSESTAKRICRKWLPAGLTRWWQAPDTQDQDDQNNGCALM